VADSTSQTTEQPDDELPVIDLTSFLRGLAACPACDDAALSERSLRAILRDYRDHARELLIQQEVARVLGLSDAEVLAEARSEGVDVEAEAARMKAMFEEIAKRHGC
jgi:hypothetical protein